MQLRKNAQGCTKEDLFDKKDQVVKEKSQIWWKRNQLEQKVGVLGGVQAKALVWVWEVPEWAEEGLGGVQDKTNRWSTR